MGEDPITVVVADDQPSYAEGLRTLFAALTEDIKVIGIATESQEAINQVKELTPDVAALDVRMPGVGGICAASDIRASAASVKVVMLTAFPEPGDARECLAIGVTGYLSKDMDSEGLIAALRAVQQGAVVVSPSAVRALLAEGATEEVSLTEREEDVIRRVAEGCDNAAIAKELFLSESTVKRRLQDIEKKLGVENKIQAAMVAARRGLI